MEKIKALLKQLGSTSPHIGAADAKFWSATAVALRKVTGRNDRWLEERLDQLLKSQKRSNKH